MIHSIKVHIPNLVDYWLDIKSLSIPNVQGNNISLIEMQHLHP